MTGPVSVGEREPAGRCPLRMKLPFRAAMAALVVWPLTGASPACAQPLPATRVYGARVQIATRIQTGSSDVMSQTDCGKLIWYSNSGATAVSLPAATSLLNGCWMDVQNAGSGTVTLTPTTSSIDGAASLALVSTRVCVSW